MTKKQFRNVSRGRALTKTEAAKVRKIRAQVEEEIPPARSNPTKVAIAKLRAMREARGMSLAEIAARTGMTRGNVARLETQKNATLQTLQRYAAALDCSLEIGFLSGNVNRKRTLTTR